MQPINPKPTGQERQQARISNHEKELLKSVFKNNEDLLLAVRNLFFGFELTKEEKDMIEGAFKDEAIRRLMRKIFLPELQRDIPIQQSVDLWMTVGIDGKAPDEIVTLLTARAILIRLLEHVLEFRLEEPSDLTINKDTDLAQLIARNQFIGHVELNLNIIRILANQEELSPEEQLERLKKDSNK